MNSQNKKVPDWKRTVDKMIELVFVIACLSFGVAFIDMGNVDAAVCSLFVGGLFTFVCRFTDAAIEVNTNEETE